MSMLLKGKSTLTADKRELENIIWLLLILLLPSCQSSSLREALNNAGPNRVELETVIEHYRDEPLKRQAAIFLVENMGTHYSIKDSLTESLALYYRKHRALSQSVNWKKGKQWEASIDSLRDCYVHLFPRVGGTSVDYDIRSVSAPWLIHNIDLAFEAWQDNVYSRNIPFHLFCRYILPYRVSDGMQLTEYRDTFLVRHKGFFSDSSIPVQDAVDSLMYLYRDLSHSDFAASNTPVYSEAVFEYLRHGLCADKCRYNVSLLRALGFAACVDFVPAWGNRNSSHSWNVLIDADSIRPFEAFWDNDRWKYKWLYDNKPDSFDPFWGRFSLPKVYRHCFTPNDRTMQLHRIAHNVNIPSLFKNIYFEDVSAQYFEAVDVEVSLSSDNRSDADVAYLCVYGNGRWHPVQWGEVKKGKALFKDMGMGSVYLPAYFISGDIIPAGEVFWINPENGLREEFVPSGGTADVTAAGIMGNNGINMHHLWASFSGSIYALDAADESRELLRIPHKLQIGHTRFKVETPVPTSKVVVSFPRKNVGFNELTLYEKKGEEIVPIRGCSVRSVDGKHSDKPWKAIFDGVHAWGCVDSLASTITIDLPWEHIITEIGITPYQPSSLVNGHRYVIDYWDNRWKSASEEIIPDNGLIYFPNVPAGRLFRIRDLDARRVNGRIFTYIDNQIFWK